MPLYFGYKNIMNTRKKTLFHYLEEYARDDGEKLCIYDNTERYTVSETLNLTRAYARTLYNMGIREGDFVGLQAKRRVRTALVIYALETLGAVAVVCHAHGGVDDFLKNTGVDMPLKARIEFRGNELVVLYEGMETPFFPDLSEKSFSVCENPDLPGLVIFTSGSTKVSKAVILSQNNMILNGLDTARAGWYMPAEKGMIITPVCHLLGLFMVICCIVVRYPLYFPLHIAPDELMAAIEKFGITFIQGVPTSYITAANYKGREKYDLSSLKGGMMGGGACGTEQFKRLEAALGMTIIPSYGMSEASGGITTMSREDSLEDRSSGTGRLLPSVKAKITDSEGKTLPDGETGEICVKGPNVMLGYYGDDKANREAFDSEGWLKTGDLGYFDEKGILRLCGRKKDIIIRGGENISCVKIECALAELPFVNAAAVVGIENELYGEIPCAMIVASSSVTEEEVRAALLKTLTKNEMPERIAFAEKLPLLDSGKPDKLAVKKYFSNG